jgi:hypothetical protein
MVLNQLRLEKGLIEDDRTRSDPRAATGHTRFVFSSPRNALARPCRLSLYNARLAVILSSLDLFDLDW